MPEGTTSGNVSFLPTFFFKEGFLKIKKKIIYFGLPRVLTAAQWVFQLCRAELASLAAVHGFSLGWLLMSRDEALQHEASVVMPPA